MSLPAYRMTTESGYTWETNMAAGITLKDAEKYFLGKLVTISEYPDEHLAEIVTKVEAAELLAEKEGSEVMDIDEYAEKADSFWCTEPKEITAEDYDEMLNVLPPEDWRNGGFGSSFKMMEYWSGNVTGIYCKIGEKYWSFRGVATMKHEEICEKCLAAKEAE